MHVGMPMCPKNTSDTKHLTFYLTASLATQGDHSSNYHGRLFLFFSDAVTSFYAFSLYLGVHLLHALSCVTSGSCSLIIPLEKAKTLV